MNQDRVALVGNGVMAPKRKKMTTGGRGAKKGKKNNPLITDNGIEPTESLEGGEPDATEKTRTAGSKRARSDNPGLEDNYPKALKLENDDEGPLHVNYRGIVSSHADSDKSVFTAGEVPSRSNLQCTQLHSTLNRPFPCPEGVQNTIVKKSLPNDSTPTSSFMTEEIYTIPAQIFGHHVQQPGMSSEPPTLESNYNPSMGACRESDSYIVEVLFHGYPMDAELDTGSPFTIISNECLTSILQSTSEDWSTQLERRKAPSTIKELYMYSGDVIKVTGQISVIITRHKQKVNANVLIVEGAPIPLLIGKDVLQHLGMELVERVLDSADECQHYQVIRPVPTGPDKVTRYLGRCPKFLKICNVNNEGDCSIARKSKSPMQTIRTPTSIR